MIRNPIGGSTPGVRWAQDTIASFGGAVIQLTIGDKGTNLYAAFGVPVAQEDAADRAAAASLALQAAPAGLGFTPRTRIGISQGPVWTGACGSSERQCYAVMGEPVNLAARLMARASPGVTLVDRRIAHLAGRHRFSAPSDTAIKGRSEPVSISTLLGRSKTPATGSRPAAAFVGRQEELARLEPLLSATLDGGCRAVVVEGVAGIGKSRLIGELAESAGRAGLRCCEAPAIRWSGSPPTTAGSPSFRRCSACRSGLRRAPRLARRSCTGSAESIPGWSATRRCSMPSSRSTSRTPRSRRRWRRRRGRAP